MLDNITIRNAKLSDAVKISELIEKHAKNEKMLAMPSELIIERIRDYFVAVKDSNIIGCCAVAFFSEKLAEIRSLAVANEYMNMGIGKRLIGKAEQILKEEGIEYAFALTVNPDFFIKMGYEKSDKDKYPLKIWKDCVKCPKIMKCDEIAVEKRL